MIYIINNGIIKKASDIHIYPNFPIKYRVKGELELDKTYDQYTIEAVISLFKFNANIDISLNKVPQSGKFEYKYENKIYYLRISTLPLNETQEGCVIRIFTDEIEKVNYSLFSEDCNIIKRLSKSTNGLIIFSGPTGSGKSTSMYKLGIDIANENKQIISIEDPIEKNIDLFVQMQINDKAGINYDNALKSILRCDPDVIMVGEIRDKKTAQYVVTSSYSGHLILTTIHAEDCIGVVNRLIDLGIGEEDLKQTILCIVSQRLVKVEKTQELITEILNKEDMKKYFINKKLYHESLEQKFKKAYDEGKISIYEKEKWGY